MEEANERESATSWWSSARVMAGRIDVSPLRWGVGASLSTHCASSTLYLASLELTKSELSSPP